MKGLINISILCFLTACGWLAGCSGCSNKDEIYSPLAEAARYDADSAVSVLLKDLSETHNLMLMQGAVLKVKACQSKYIQLGDTVAAQIFDEQFKKTLRERNDSIAKLIVD